MTAQPLAAAERLPANAWVRLREQAIFDCCKWDIQSEDHCVLADYPLLLPERNWQTLKGLAENLAVEALAAEAELTEKLELHAILGLPSAVRIALSKARLDAFAAGGTRVMRFDFHFTALGWRISEANTDVPGGFIEASGFTRLMAERYSLVQPPDVAAAYADALRHAAGEDAVVGLVHATAHSDDRQVMQYLARYVRCRGMHPVLLSPAHLRWESGCARSFDAFGPSSPGSLVRFFPADWLPSLGKSALWAPWFTGSRTPLSNPGTALLTQSKRFPLTWDALRSPLPAWRNLLPFSTDPCRISQASEDEWVFKPALGRVGEDIAMAGVTESRRYLALRDSAWRHPRDWVAQERFQSVPVETPDGPRHVCLGVFTIDARAAGIYGRLSAKPLIDQDAQDVAVLLTPEEGCNAFR